MPHDGLDRDDDGALASGRGRAGAQDGIAGAVNRGLSDFLEAGVTEVIEKPLTVLERPRCR
jgi:hypothetical protein